MGARAEAGDVEDLVYSSVYLAVCAKVGGGPRYMIFFHTFMHVARVRKHTDMRDSELHAKRIARETRAILTCPSVF